MRGKEKPNALHMKKNKSVNTLTSGRGCAAEETMTGFGGSFDSQGTAMTLLQSLLNLDMSNEQQNAKGFGSKERFPSWQACGADRLLPR